tara:strand:- start:24737 stop:24889 length:153 start_codon:yes stop_codon:yes gene_type:complete
MYVYLIRSLETDELVTEKKFERIVEALNYRAKLDQTYTAWIDCKFIPENA